MKTIVLFLVVGALATLAGAFFEMWTIPRLEGLPTISSYATRSRSLESEAERQFQLGSETAPPGGPLAPKSSGPRNAQLNNARNQLER